ncbi:MAG: hypothetical protein ABSB35_41865 [Bryobacteraceae bacterium]|jgi:hypothetical protein
MRLNFVAAVTLSCVSLFGAGSDDSMDVIVRFKNSQDQVGQRRFVERGAIHKRSLELVNAHVYTVKSRDLNLLASDPEVEYLGPDHPLQATGNAPTLTQPDYGWMTALGVTSPTATLKWDRRDFA